MRRGEHCARRVEFAGSEIEQVRACQPEIDHVDSATHRTLCESVGEAFSGEAHIACHQHRGRTRELGETDTKRVRDVLIHLIRSCTAHVIGLDDAIKDCRINLWHVAERYRAIASRTRNILDSDSVAERSAPEPHQHRNARNGENECNLVCT